MAKLLISFQMIGINLRNAAFINKDLMCVFFIYNKKHMQLFDFRHKTQFINIFYTTRNTSSFTIS